jgi:hypothetical protein
MILYTEDLIRYDKIIDIKVSENTSFYSLTQKAFNFGFERWLLNRQKRLFLYKIIDDNNDHCETIVDYEEMISKNINFGDKKEHKFKIINLNKNIEFNYIWKCQNNNSGEYILFNNETYVKLNEAFLSWLCVDNLKERKEYSVVEIKIIDNVIAKINFMTSEMIIKEKIFNLKLIKK